MDRYPSIRSQRIIIAAAAVIMLLLPLPAPAAGPLIGNIRAIDSVDPDAVAKIVRIGFVGIISGKPGVAVYTGDTVKTGEGVRAQIELSDNSIITIAPNSAVLLKGHSVDRDHVKRNSVLRTMKGTVRFLIAKSFKPQAEGTEKKWKESIITIEAQNVQASVKGTDLAVTSLGSESEIAVFDGTVIVRHASPTIRGDAMLGGGQFSTVTRLVPPSLPSALSPDRQAVLVKLTTLTNPRTTAQASDTDIQSGLATALGAGMTHGGKSDAKKVCNEKDVAKDLAAGMPLADVLDKNVDCGMPLADVICGIMDSGVNPSTCVYTAVIEGYNPKEVVTAAIECGAPPAVVMSAALGAGADKNLVISGATDAGVPPATTATVIAAATSPNAPVYRTMAPMDSSPASIIPAPSAFGGGGGGTPSTQPASPYRP